MTQRNGVDAASSSELFMAPFPSKSDKDEMLERLLQILFGGSIYFILQKTHIDEGYVCRSNVSGKIGERRKR